MALTITDQVMRSPDTAHTARNRGDGTWEVSWLPKRTQLDRNQAISAMTIAEEVGRIPADAGPDAYSPELWALVDSLATELGLSGPDAVARASESPGRCGDHQASGVTNCTRQAGHDGAHHNGSGLTWGGES